MVEIINKRNRAVFEVEMDEAVELIKNFGELLETDAKLPEEPKKVEEVPLEEQKILGLDKDIEKTDAKLPEEPKKVEPQIKK